MYILSITALSRAVQIQEMAVNCKEYYLPISSGDGIKQK